MKIALTLSVGILLNLQSAIAADSGLKFGFVDLQKALQSVETGKKAKSNLEKEVQAKKTELEKKQAAFQKEAEAFEKKAAILNESAKATKQAELQKKFMELQKQAQESQMDLQKRERELTQPILTELKAIIEALGKEKGMAFVLEKNESGMLYADPVAGVDLTDSAVDKFNAKNKK